MFDSHAYRLTISKARTAAGLARFLRRANATEHADARLLEAIRLGRSAASHRRRMIAFDAPPSPGPFVCGTFEVETRDGFVHLIDNDATHDRRITPTMAREMAAAFIECADFIDRANMTPEQTAEETAKRC